MLINKSCSFTGHRPNTLGGYGANNNFAVQIKKDLRSLIRHAYKAGYRRYVSGLALGVDTWAAQSVIELKEHYSDVSLVAAIPFATQACRWSTGSYNEWLDIINASDEVVIVNDLSADVKQVGIEAVIDACIHQDYSYYQVSRWLQERNEWMVAQSDLLLAVWRGTSGGTANCVKHAQKENKKILIYNPDDRSTSWTNRDST